MTVMNETSRVTARSRLLRQTGLAVVCSVPLLLDPSLVLAQEASASSQSTSQEAQPGALADIIVTGSRIRRPNIDTTVPVTSLARDELLSTGTVSVGDALNDLPALRSTFGSGNSTRFIGTAGLNFLDLRGLGTSRTLVLVNGRRHVPAYEGDNSVDVNTIPTDLIERVDVVTGGNSAIYGSDAIAGVVNFVLKRDFEGVEVRAQNGLSSRGDAHSYFVSGTFGHNFGADKKGNISVALEYSKQQDLYMEDRPTTRRRGQFVIVDTDPAGTTNGSDGTPDRIYVKDVRNVLLSEGGTWSGTNTSGGNCDGPGVVIPAGKRDIRCVAGSSKSRVYRFQPDGSIREADYGDQDFRLLANNSSGGDGSTLRRYGQLQPEIERLTSNVLLHYDVSEAFKPFIEAKFVRVNVIQQSSPSFDQTVDLSIDNPFLSAQAREFFKQALGPSEKVIRINRNNLDLGSREERTRRDTWRIVAGAEGDFADAWHYEVSANYGEFKRRMFSDNNRVRQRWAFATDAVTDSATGKIVCRVTIDPAARKPVSQALAKYLDEDVAKCVPINLFGDGAPSQEAKDYVNTSSRMDGKHTQFVVNGFLSGDSSAWFELPGGPVGIAIGTEYRRETTRVVYDDLVASGGTFLNALQGYVPPAFEVKELFSELRLPILANMKFAHELTLEGAVRASDYKGSTGTVFAYNLSGIYAPIRDVRLRVGYAKAVRAPTLGELYTPARQNFAFINDPCDTRYIGAGSPNRAANCAAAGIPSNFQNVPASLRNTDITSAGNPELAEESSRSWTIGGVFQPRFLPGFTLSVDYYNIRVSDVISAPTPQAVVNSCYDSASLDNMFCKLFKRDPSTHYFVPGSLQNISINYAARTARGVDAEMNYRFDIEGAGSFGLRGIVTYAIERNNYPFLDEPNRPDRILSELGDPRWAANASLSWEKGPLNARWEVRYIGKQVVNLAEDIYSVGGKPPQDADYAETMFYPDVFYHDVRVGYSISEKYNVYVGVDNLFDRMPPLGLTGVGDGSGIYENRGRFFYIGASAKF